MCAPQKKGNAVCACTARTGSEETFCECSEMKEAFEKRLAALEKKAGSN